MTQVIFKMVHPDGSPRADELFQVRLTRSGLNDADNSVVLKDVIEATTDAQGQFTLELEATTTLYKLRVLTKEDSEECYNGYGESFDFYVPESSQPVYVQDLIMLPPPTNVPWDEEAMNKIMQAVVDSKGAAAEAKASEIAADASADRAEVAAVGVEDAAARAAASATAAKTSETNAKASETAANSSKNAAATSAAAALASQNAAKTSETNSKASETAAKTSETNSKTSETNAKVSETAANNSKNAAATSATNAAGSATAAGTSATNAANSATAAAGSAVTAKNEADRAKGYADSINPDGLAPINSPTFTGDPKAPTPARGDKDTSVATTAFVDRAIKDIGFGDVDVNVMANVDDATIASGFYYTSSSDANRPLGTNGVILHKMTGSAGFQLFQPGGVDRLMYRRRAGGVWKSWRDIDASTFGIGSTTYQPNWPNTSLDDCTGVLSGVYRTIAATTGLPAGISTASVLKYWIRDADTAGVYQVVQELTNALTSRKFTRVAPSYGTAAAPNWSAWREDVYTDSPVFTGNPTAPTAAQFDNDTSLATTAFVQRALGNLAGTTSISVSTTMSAADAGKLIQVNPGGGTVNVTLPLAASCPEGTILWLRNINTGTVNIVPQGSDNIGYNSGGNSFYGNPTLGNGDTMVLQSNGGNTWRSIGGSAQLKYQGVFGASLNSNGYQKLPSGLIVQWGRVPIPTSPAEAANTISLPIAFPNQALLALASLGYGGTSASWSNFTVWSSNLTTTQITCAIASGATSRTETAYVNFIAFGF